MNKRPFSIYLRPGPVYIAVFATVDSLVSLRNTLKNCELWGLYMNICAHPPHTPTAIYRGPKK